MKYTVCRFPVLQPAQALSQLCIAVEMYMGSLHLRVEMGKYLNCELVIQITYVTYVFVGSGIKFNFVEIIK